MQKEQISETSADNQALASLLAQLRENSAKACNEQDTQPRPEVSADPEPKFEQFKSRKAENNTQLMQKNMALAKSIATKTNAQPCDVVQREKDPGPAAKTFGKEGF